MVNIGSLAAKSASRWVGAYPATKHAVAAYSQQLRLELGPEGLHVLLVCPGPITRKDERLYPLAGLEDVPERARRPGAGVRVRTIPPRRLAQAILRACERRRAELVDARQGPAAVCPGPALAGAGRLDRAADDVRAWIVRVRDWRKEWVVEPLPTVDD